jgi:hypothetical protein
MREMRCNEAKEKGMWKCEWRTGVSGSVNDIGRWSARRGGGGSKLLWRRHVVRGPHQKTTNSDSPPSLKVEGSGGSDIRCRL